MANINGMTVEQLVADDTTAISRSIEGLIERYYKLAENTDYWASCYKYDKAAELAIKCGEVEHVLSWYFGIYPDEWSYCDDDGRWHRYR